MEFTWITFGVDTKKILPAKGPIQIQTHGGATEWKNIYIRELLSEEANYILRKFHLNNEKKNWISLTSETNWKGAVKNYEWKLLDSNKEVGFFENLANQGGILFSKKKYSDFVFSFEFQLSKNANSGLLIRYPGKGNGAYNGMAELQILDNTSSKYKNLDIRQYHGSLYGMVPALRGYLRPIKKWNHQIVSIKGSHVIVELNGNIILDADLSKAQEPFLDNKPHFGKSRKKGYLGIAGHGGSDSVLYKELWIKEW